MRSSKTCRITLHLKYLGSFILLLSIIFSMLPQEPNTRFNQISIESNVNLFNNKLEGKAQTITNIQGTPITGIGRNETAYFTGTIYTGAPSYPEPLDVWGYLARSGTPIEQGTQFGKTQTDPNDDHRFVIPLQNGTSASRTFYENLKGKYQIVAYIPDYEQSTSNLIISPPGTWGTPNTLDIFAYSDINVNIDGSAISDTSNPVLRGRFFTIQLQAKYDDSTWIDSRNTAIDFTLQTPFNTEGWTSQTQSIKSAQPIYDFSIGVPYDQPPGVYACIATLDHSSLSSTEDPYLKGNNNGGISRITFHVEVLDNNEHYSKVDVSGQLVAHPGSTLNLVLQSLNLADNSPLTSNEGLQLVLEGPFNSTSTPFYAETWVYAPDNQYTFTVQVPNNQSSGDYKFTARLDHRDHTIRQDSLLWGVTTDYTSEKQFTIKVRHANDSLIYIYYPDRDVYLWRTFQELSVWGAIDPATENIPLTINIGEFDSGIVYTSRTVDTDFSGGFSTTFNDLTNIPSGGTYQLWVDTEFRGPATDQRDIIIQSTTSISIDTTDPDPSISTQTVNIHGGLYDDIGVAVANEAVSVLLVDEDLIMSDYTSSSGLFDIALISPNVSDSRTFTLQANYLGRVPYYYPPNIPALKAIRVDPLTPPVFTIELNITGVEEPPEGIRLLRTESVLVQGHIQEDHPLQGINPVPGVDVEVHLGIHDKQTSYVIESTVTDELGNFAILISLNGSIPVGDWLLWAETPNSGFEPNSETKDIRIWSLSEIRDISVQPLEFDRAYSGGEIQVNGSLVDDQGQPITSSQVVVMNWDEEPPVTELNIDPNGWFSTILIAPEVPTETTVTLHTNYEQSEYYGSSTMGYPVKITPHGPTFLTLAVNRTLVYPGENLTATGTLRDQFGGPLPAGQTIELVWDGFPGTVISTTDDNSDFSAPITTRSVDLSGEYLLLATFSQITGYQEATTNTSVHIFMNILFKDVRLTAMISNETLTQRIPLRSDIGVLYETNVNITILGTLVDDSDTQIRNRPLMIILINNATSEEIRIDNLQTNQAGEFSVTLPSPIPGTYRFVMLIATETGTEFSSSTSTFTIIEPRSDLNLFMFAVVDGVAVIGGVIIAYFLHKRGMILSKE